MMNEISQDTIKDTLDNVYNQAVQGVLGSKNCYELAEEYLSRYETKEEACKQFINNQITKCTTSGFVTGLGGFLTMPVAIPANLISVWYVQLRMLATIAVMGGFEPDDDSVQTLCYVCLVGGSLTKMFKDVTVKVGEKVLTNAIKKIPTSIIKQINAKACCRLITKFGTRGVINLGNLIPLVGGVVGGSLDFAETFAMANRAKKMFLQGTIED